MNEKTISLTLPLTAMALRHAATMLNNVADDLNPVFTEQEVAENKPGVETETFKDDPVGNASRDIADASTKEPEEKDPKAVFGTQPGKPDQPATSAPEPETATTAPQSEPPAGVDVDADGLPWDGRIHASSKKKKVGDQKWKRKRGVDEATVEQVEAELRAAMAAKPTDQPPAPPAEQTGQPPAPTQEQAAATPPPPPEQAAAIKTFPELMQRITSSGKTTEEINPVLQKYGFASLPLLAARPDMVETVAAELFPEG